MNDLMPQMSDAALATRGDDGLARMPRRMQRAVDGQIGRGLVRAAAVEANTYVAHARVEGTAFVARMGLQRVAELSHEAARFTAQSPTAAGRFEAVADAFTSVVVNEVIKLGYDR